MASISKQANGRKVIQFVASDEKRRSIRLGKVSLRQAQAVKFKVEDLLGSSITGSAPMRETSEWLADLDDGLYDKLAAVGLVQHRGRATLAAFIEMSDRMLRKQLAQCTSVLADILLSTLEQISNYEI